MLLSGNYLGTVELSLCLSIVNIPIKVSLSYQAFPLALVPGKQLNMGGVGDGSLLNHLDKGHGDLKFFVLPRIALKLITFILVIK